MARRRDYNSRRRAAMRMEHQQLMENSHISNDETDNSLSNSNQDGIGQDKLSRRKERDRLRRQRETIQERHARLKLSVLLHVSELSFKALFRLAMPGLCHISSTSL